MSKKKRIPISLDKLLDAYPVDRCIPSSIVSQNFEHSYRNKKPVIIAGGALTWLGINTALGAVYTILSLVEECEIDALVALDGRQFLKNDLCKFERIDLTAGITRILCRKESEICIKEGNLVPGFDEERTYLRIYFDSHPKLLGQIDLSFLVMLMSLTLTTEANSDQIHQFEQQPLFINPSTFPLVPSFVKPVELLSSSTGIGVDTSPFQLKNIGLWASSEGCVTPLHFDLCHGFLAQVKMYYYYRYPYYHIYHYYHYPLHHLEYLSSINFYLDCRQENVYFGFF